jgi:hypothetical protein
MAGSAADPARVQCVSEWLYREMADRLAEDGWREAGWEFVDVDDCWQVSAALAGALCWQGCVGSDSD